LNNSDNHNKHEENHKKFYERSFVLMIFLFITAIMLVWLYNYFYPQKIGMEQPIPFSHRLHAGEKKISCFMCHDTAPKAANAGLPPVETCMLCHQTIIIHYPEIEKVRNHFFENKPIEWKKVFDLPDFVYFNHSVHIQRGIDCSECHGNVNKMDRVEDVKDIINMGFCLDCHKKNNATTDCFTCHR